MSTQTTGVPQDVESAPPRGGLRGMLHRLTSPDSVVEADELQEFAQREGATTVRRCQQGREVCVAGAVRSLRVAPVAGTPSYEVELYDGSGSVRLVFLGRRNVRGIEPGGELVAHGRLTDRDGRPTIYNPRYELVLPHCEH